MNEHHCAYFIMLVMKNGNRIDEPLPVEKRSGIMKEMARKKVLIVDVYPRKD